MKSFGYALLVYVSCCAAATSACEPTLRYLASRIPSYNDPDLQKARDVILSTDIKAVLAQAAAQGHDGAMAVRLSRGQAKQAEGQITEARTAAIGMAADENKTRDIVALHAGQRPPVSGERTRQPGEHLSIAGNGAGRVSRRTQVRCELLANYAQFLGERGALRTT